jgi:hypothetical protein
MHVHDGKLRTKKVPSESEEPSLYGERSRVASRKQKSICAFNNSGLATHLGARPSEQPPMNHETTRAE